jgi:hypothetical protein
MVAAAMMPSTVRSPNGRDLRAMSGSAVAADVPTAAVCAMAPRFVRRPTPNGDEKVGNEIAGVRDQKLAITSGDALATMLPSKTAKAVPENGRRAGQIRSEIAGEALTQSCGNDPFGDVGNKDGGAPFVPEELIEVGCATIPLPS